jgi:hypothetical protein
MHCALAMKLRSPHMACGSAGAAGAGVGGAAATAGAGSSGVLDGGAATAACLRGLAAGFGDCRRRRAGARFRFGDRRRGLDSLRRRGRWLGRRCRDSGSSRLRNRRRCILDGGRRLARPIAIPARDDHHQRHHQQAQPQQDHALARRPFDRHLAPDLDPGSFSFGPLGPGRIRCRRRSRRRRGRARRPARAHDHGSVVFVLFIRLAGGATGALPKNEREAPAQVHQDRTAAPEWSARATGRVRWWPTRVRGWAAGASRLSGRPMSRRSFGRNGRRHGFPCCRPDRSRPWLTY